MLESILLYFSGPWGMVEFAAMISTAICVILAARQNIWTWPWGVIGVVLYGALFYEYKLYSDALLQIAYYFPLQFVGWYWWLKRGPNANNDLPVIVLSWNWRIITLIGISISSLMLGYVMATYTNADFAYLDALTTMMSIVAQYFLIKKVWESWVLWVSMDIIAIPLYFTKGLIVTSGIYGVFLVIASLGLYSWYKELNKSNNSILNV